MVELCWLCAHHMFLKVNHVPIVLYISSKVMGGRKLKLRHIKNAEKRGSLVVAIPRAQVYVPVTEGLTLSLPVPEVISVQPSKAPDHGHDQASDHTVVKSLCVSFPLFHFTGGLVQSLSMLSERISMVTLPPSWVPIISDGSQSFSISKLIEQRNHATVCLVINSDMQWSVHTTHRQFSTHNCVLLSELPILLNSIDNVFKILERLDHTTFCAGNPDQDLVTLWYQQMFSLYGCSGNCVAIQCNWCLNLYLKSYVGQQSGYLDHSLISNQPTVRHNDCCVLLAVRCSPRSSFRSTLRSRRWRIRSKSENSETRHKNYWYVRNIVKYIDT